MKSPLPPKSPPIAQGWTRSLSNGASSAALTCRRSASGVLLHAQISAPASGNALTTHVCGSM